MDSPGSARRDVGIAPYRVRADSPQTVRNQVRSARAAEGVGPYVECAEFAEEHVQINAFCAGG